MAFSLKTATKSDLNAYFNDPRIVTGKVMRDKMQSIWDRYHPAATKPVAAAGKTGVGAGASAALKAARDLYAPGGAYGKGLDAALERGSKKAVAGGTQALVSAGLASTSMGAGLSKQYEEEVATPARANLESNRAQALAGISMTEAGMQFQSSETATGREFQASESALDRGNRLATAGGGGGFIRGPSASSQLSTFASRARERAETGLINAKASSLTSAPAAGQHVPTGGSGMGSFLKNLQSSDLMASSGGGSTQSWASSNWWDG